MNTAHKIVLSIGISKFSVEALDEFYEGVYAFVKNTMLVGRRRHYSSQKGFVISITAIGEVAPDTYVTRNGAKLNDLIFASDGDLGGGAF